MEDNLNDGLDTKEGETAVAIEDPIASEYEKKIQEEIKNIELKWDSYLKSGDLENSESFLKADRKISQIESGVHEERDFLESKSNISDLHDYLFSKRSEIIKPLDDLRVKIELTGGKDMDPTNFANLLSSIDAIKTDHQYEDNKSIENLKTRHKKQAKLLELAKIDQIRRSMN